VEGKCRNKNGEAERGRVKKQNSSEVKDSHPWPVVRSLKIILKNFLLVVEVVAAAAVDNVVVVVTREETKENYQLKNKYLLLLPVLLV